MFNPTIKLRPYQHEAVKEIFIRFDKVQKQLVSMPTGVGKTIALTYAAGAWPDAAADLGLSPRVLWLAHTDELVWQAAAQLHAMTGEEVGIEKAELSTVGETITDNRLVVASVQTLCSEARRLKMDRGSFGLVIADEAHHYVAEVFSEVLNYFQPARIVGITATTARADQVSLGKMFDEVAYHYDLLDAIKDGWLAPIKMQHIEVESLDFSGIPSGAGDFTDAQLASIIEEETVIHGIVAPVIEAAGDRQTIIFTPSVASAEMVATVLNRPKYSNGRAAWVSGETDQDERRATIKAYKEGKIQFLANCSVLLEGFDAPSTSCIVVARPTKSVALLAQMVGRGERGGPMCPIPGKTDNLVLDLVGSCGRHKLVNAVDLLGASYCEEVKAEAHRRCEESIADGEDASPMDELARAALIADELKAQRRREIIAEATTKRKTIDPFDMLDIADRELPGWWDLKPITEGQKEALTKAGIKIEGDLDYSKAQKLLNELRRRQDMGLCSYKQARSLQARGFCMDLTWDQASILLSRMSDRRGGWKFGQADARLKAMAKKRGRGFSYHEVPEWWSGMLPRWKVPSGVDGVVTGPDGKSVQYRTKKASFFFDGEGVNGQMRFQQGDYILQVSKESAEII